MGNNSNWAFWFSSNVRTISFKSEVLILWATQQAIIVYDLQHKIGYAVIYNQDTEVFEGETRPLSVTEDDVYAPDFRTWRWMTEEDKQKMIDLLRKVISYCRGVLPQAYQWIWSSGVDEAKTLIIQKPGELKYTKYFIPSQV